MSSESLAQAPVLAPQVAPSLADLLALRNQSPQLREADTPQDLKSNAPQPVSEDCDTVVTMPFLRNSEQHFSSIGSPSPGGSVDTERAIPMVPAHAPKGRVPLVLVHGNASEGTLAQTWMHRVLEGDQLYGVRFQDNAADAIHRQQPQAILIQFIPGATDTAVKLSGQLQLIFPHIPRIAIGHSKYPESMLAALRAGVQDFLDMDGPLDAAQQAVRHLLSQPPVADLSRQRAPLTALVSARAGLGCSVLASHLAWHLQQRLASHAGPSMGNAEDDAEELACLLMELGTPGGDCAIYLNTPGEFSFSDAVSHQRRLDRRMAQSALARHESGLRLLTQAQQTKAIPANDTEALLSRLGQYFQHLVLDLGTSASSAMVMDALPNANELWVLCDQSVASVVWTTELLNQLEALQVPRDRMQLLVCRNDPRMELSAAQIARQLQLPLLGVIPERRRELAQVVNQGALFASQAKREPYVQAVDALVQKLLRDHHPELAAHTPAPAGRWSHLLQRFKRD